MSTEAEANSTKKVDRIRVLIRPRPFLHREVGEEEVLHIVNDQTVVLDRGANGSAQFSFDKVFDKRATQQDVYNELSEGIDAVLDGINCTIFAYGQTGTGKTYTMLGVDDLTGVVDKRLEEVAEQVEKADRRGLIPSAVDSIISFTETAKEERDYTLHVSYLEIYNEKIYDLLAHGKKRELNVLEDKKRGVYVQDAKEVLVASREEIFSLMERGQSKRFISTTGMNDQSSRSHTIFQLFVEYKSREGNRVRRAKLNLVDLAGSEKWDVGQHNYVAMAKEIKELTNINQSLSALGNCIAALSQKGRKHIPYRDSKLTRLLKDSLGGNTMTTFVATLSPAAVSLEETLQTLKFMERTKRIVLEVAINEEVDQDELVEQYARETALMRQFLERKETEDMTKLYRKLEEMDRENVRLRGDLARTQNWLYQEKEERDKLTMVFKAAIVNIKNLKEPQAKAEAAEQTELQLLRDEVGYMKLVLAQATSSEMDMEARRAELDEYHAWLSALEYRHPEDGEDEATLAADQKIKLLEGELRQSRAELLGTKRQFVEFLEKVQAALQLKCAELREAKKREGELQKKMATVQAAAAAKESEKKNEEAPLTRQQLLALLEKEAAIKQTKDSLLTMFGELSSTLDTCLEAVHSIRSYSSLSSAKGALVEALEGVSDELHRLEDGCFGAMSEPALFGASPAVGAKVKSTIAESRRSSMGGNGVGSVHSVPSSQSSDRRSARTPREGGHDVHDNSTASSESKRSRKSLGSERSHSAASLPESAGSRPSLPVNYSKTPKTPSQIKSEKTPGASAKSASRTPFHPLGNDAAPSQPRVQIGPVINWGPSAPAIPKFGAARTPGARKGDPVVNPSRFRR